MSIHLAQLIQWKMHRIVRYRSNSAFPVSILLIELFRKTTQKQSTASHSSLRAFYIFIRFFSAVFFGFVRTTSGEPLTQKQRKGKRNQKEMKR